MANIKHTLKENVEGNYYVDSSCFNCGASRHYSPNVFGNAGDHAFVKKQPENQAEELATNQAIIMCPTASIGVKNNTNLKPVIETFPIKMANGVYLNGFNHRKSYGAHSYFIKSNKGNWLIDSPRYTPHLLKQFREMGGIKYIFLTHRDDVCDANRYANYFNAKRIIHKLDLETQKDSEIILEGESEYKFDKGIVYFTPGHTPGHIVLLWQEKYLFTGDHYAWLSSLNQFGSFPDACWYSWKKQIESVNLMSLFKDVEWVLPGHGKWGKVSKGEFPAIVKESVSWMKKVRKY